jgi:CheY-like chemotaxis protein
VVLGIAEMQLEKNDLFTEKREAWDKVYASGYLLLNIINDILDLSKIEAGKLELSSVNYDVASLINDSVQLNILRFDDTLVQFVLQADENIPATLYGDDLRVKQILNNILSNSFKYTVRGEIVMSVSAEVTGPDNPVILVFSIKDTGHGMTKEQVDSLFVDYSRFNMEANRAVEGTGLGMSITKHLVEMMNGGIDIESKVGKGSTFTVKLPQGYVDSGVLGKEGVENLRKLHRGTISQPRKGLSIVREYMPYGKILVVDDMEPNLYVARGLLAPYGLSISTALSGYETIDLIKSGKTFDVIFMDHFMPKMDGMETTKIIRSLGYTFPIVALTANALAGQAEVFLENGFDGFISKPVDIRQLNSTLNKMVRDRYPVETVEAARKLKSQLEQNTGTAPLELNYEKALVVDDFLPNLSMAVGMLRKYKMQVDSVLSGQEAVDLIKKGEPEYTVIFMDHLMPEMDGIEAARLIRSLGTEYAKNIPIIAVTAVTPDEAAAKEKLFLANGFQGLLAKPLGVAKLDVFLKKWMRDKMKIDSSVANNREDNMVLEIPGIDTEKVMDLYAGDLEIYLPVLRSYLSVIPDALDKMSRVSAQNLPEYVVKVHGVKSTSDGIGAEEARKMAYELEMLGKAGDLSGVLVKNGALLSYVKELLVNIQSWLSKIDAK